MILKENILFHDRYQLIRLLGRGGFSEVWLAQDNLTQLKIAIKIYAPGGGMDDDGVEVFSRELKNVYNIRHTNILKPQHFDIWERMPYLILPYCSKGSCQKRIGAMKEEDIWHLLSHTSAALNHLHSQPTPIIHQDVKPDNILIDDNNNFLLTDFGISTQARNTLRKSMLATTTNSGTVAYMPPERFSKNPAPIKAGDVWSLGATIYEIMTGDVPFGELGGGLQKSGAEIPDILGDYSDDLKQTITACLAIDPWDRPTAEALYQYATDQLHSTKSKASWSQKETTAAMDNVRATQRMSSSLEEAIVPPKPFPPIYFFFTIGLFVVFIIYLIISETVGFEPSIVEEFDAPVDSLEAVPADTFLVVVDSMPVAENDFGVIVDSALVVFESASVEFDVYDYDRDSNYVEGMRIHVKFNDNIFISDVSDVVAYFYYSDGNPLYDKNGKYTTSENTVCEGACFLRGYSTSSDFIIFMPFDELHIKKTGNTTCAFNITIWDRATSRELASSSLYYFLYSNS